jgi:hypothetical protein
VQKAALFIVISPVAGLLVAAGVFALTQLSSHLLAGATLAVLGLGLAVVLWIGLQRTARSRHFEPDRPATQASAALTR